MKDLIVTVGLILLGCMLFDFIAGDGESLRTVSGQNLQRMMEWYEEAV